MFIILLLISQTETKKQLIVCVHERTVFAAKAYRVTEVASSFRCPGRWSLRLAPLTVHALGSRSPSSYG
jgi:hypothetical protein